MENKNYIKDILKDKFDKFLRDYTEKKKIFEDAFGVEDTVSKSVSKKQ